MVALKHKSWASSWALFIWKQERRGGIETSLPPLETPRAAWKQERRGGIETEDNLGVGNDEPGSRNAVVALKLAWVARQQFGAQEAGTPWWH